MKSLDISDGSRILIVAPHPDDECIGCGGVLIKYARYCDIIVLTDGRQGQGDESPLKVREIRKREFENEMGALHVNSYRRLDIEDGTLLLHTDCLSGSILKGYDYIFVTGMNDEHPDHKAAYMCVQQATKDWTDEYRPRCFLYEVHTPISHPSHFLDITNSIQRKIDLIRYHKSQLKELPYDELAEQCATYRATLFRMPLKKIEVYEEVFPTDTATECVTETESLLQKERVIGWALKRWVNKLINNESLSHTSDFLPEEEIYIYGYGELGKLLIKELKKENIKIKAVIDRRAEQFKNEDIAVICIEEAQDRFPIIVTAIYDYSEIEKQLKKRGFERVCSLRTMLETD